jgi:hypothetical protein
LTEDYQPLDMIRASYRLQRQTLDTGLKMESSVRLFEGETSGAAQTAWACVVYSMVPYLGILFVPFAFAAAGYTYVSPTGSVEQSRRVARICLGLSVFILLAQIGMWWLLYIIPTVTLSIPISN